MRVVIKKCTDRDGTVKNKSLIGQVKEAVIGKSMQLYSEGTSPTSRTSEVCKVEYNDPSITVTTQNSVYYLEEYGIIDSYMCINDIAKLAHKIAVKRGKVDCDTTIIDQFKAVQEEVEELYKAIDINKNTGTVYLPDTFNKEFYDIFVTDGIGAEIADSIISLLTMSKMIDIDIQKYIEWNLQYGMVRDEK